MARRATVLILATLTLAGPAQAHTRPGGTSVIFSGALPCSVACSYWVSSDFAPCENPFPPGSWVDNVTSPAPAPSPGRVVVLETALDMQIDWDGFLCANDETRRELSQGANLHCAEEYYLLIFCLHEDMSTRVVADQTVIFRAYSWSDPFDAVGHYWFTVI